VSPTFEAPSRARRERRRLSRAQRAGFRRRCPRVRGRTRDEPAAVSVLAAGEGRPGHPGVYELSFGEGGRATFAYGDEVVPGQPHVIWRRIGDHSIFADP
jgi:hypothetical protein